MSSTSPRPQPEWIDSSDDEEEHPEARDGASKVLTRQDSIHDLSKTLTRQNSLHEGDLHPPNFNLSNERSLSWDNYVENYNKNADDILRGLIEIREELRSSSDEELELEEAPQQSPRRGLSVLSGSSTDTTSRNLSLSIDSHHYRRHLSHTSSKNTRCSSNQSEFSFEGTWNSKQSFSVETYQSHQHQQPHGSGETSSGIKSISDDSDSSRTRPSDGSSSGRGLGSWPGNESDDPYEYDDEMAMEMSTQPPTANDELLVEVLCSERVSQMSKTYNDIEAVTRLLEEKEKDLELTARIGKELLAHNNKLESNVTALETELKTANDRIEQMSHELVKKTELIQVLTNDTDESGSEAGTPSGLRCINLEFMQRRVKGLEDENKSLRREFTQLTKDAESCEELEQRLMQDIRMQLENASVEVKDTSDDLERQKEENRVQYEQIVSLQGKLQDTDTKLHKVMVEHEDTQTMLNITRENQNKLAGELLEFKERYNEVMNLLQDSQQELKRQRKKAMPSVRGGVFSSLTGPTSNLPGDSLASELESSLYSELSLDSGISADRVPNYKKVFETVRYASKPGTSSPTFQRATVIQPSMVSSSAGPRMSAFASYPSVGGAKPLGMTQQGCATVYSSMSCHSLDSIGHSDTESVASDEMFPHGPATGVPGVPGSTELAHALSRLTPAEVNARRAALANPPGYPAYGGYGEYDATIVPLGCRTPDSIMSTGSSSGYGGHPHPWRLPDKLQIVKPMEGSQTLHHWSQLATPTMSGLLEERPGVKTKGGRCLEDIGLELYTLSDLEEDEEVVNPGKSFQDSGTIYTFTNSTVMHPDDNTSVTHSLRGSKLCTMATNSRQSTAPPTPRPLSRRNSTSTFSMTFGLAKLLNERGIEAVTASALNTPSCETSFTPTATPANSPDGSPVHSRSPSPSPAPFNPLKLPGFLTNAAGLLGRTFLSDGGHHSPRRSRPRRANARPDRKGLPGIGLVKKIENIGIESIGVAHPALQGAPYTRRGLPSPMAQLTSLKATLHSPSVDSELSELSKPPKLGVPARPGSGALTRRVRPDLGKVSTPVSSPSQEQSSGPLGTLSSMLFGRKGGLL